jgi:dTMP kinase
MAAGCFVVLEGPEGTGKSTLAVGLAARMGSQKIDLVRVREPGGTPLAEMIRHELWHADRPWTAEAELLFVVTARADLVSSVIRPALAAGKVVLSDRFDLSTKVYQGAGRGLPMEMVTWVNDAATGGLNPDATLVLDLDPSIGRDRQLKAGKSPDRMEREGPGFHDRVAAGYLAASGPGVHHLDGAASPEMVLDNAWDILVGALPNTFRPWREQENG